MSFYPSKKNKMQVRSESTIFLSQTVVKVWIFIYLCSKMVSVLRSEYVCIDFLKVSISMEEDEYKLFL